MKKVIIFIICLLFLAGCGKKDVYKFTVDINPSVEIEMKDGKANKIIALSDDGKELIEGHIDNQILDRVFDIIVQNSKEKYLDNNVLTVILGIENDDKNIEQSLRDACKKNKVKVNIIVPEITEEARKEAEGYGVTPAKAAFILEILKGKDDLHFDDIKDKPIKELEDMKTTGLYCDREYTLRNGACEKVIKEEKPEEGKKCPEGYQQIKDKCYRIGPSTHEPYCSKGTELKEGKCVGKEESLATAHCVSGTYNSSTKKCEVSTYTGEGTKKCNGDGKISQKGTCTYGKPTIDGACLDNDQLIDGMCYNMIDGGDQYPTVICPNGQGVRDGKCYKVETSSATYTCNKGKLVGDKCVVETSKDPVLKVACEKGLTNFKDRACLDMKDTIEFTTGLICKDNARLENKMCVYYEVVDAKGK